MPTLHRIELWRLLRIWISHSNLEFSQAKFLHTVCSIGTKNLEGT